MWPGEQYVYIYMYMLSASLIQAETITHIHRENAFTSDKSDIPQSALLTDWRTKHNERLEESGAH
jgi:hypothetical protein